jgi:hypothetical protein
VNEVPDSQRKRRNVRKPFILTIGGLILATVSIPPWEVYWSIYGDPCHSVTYAPFWANDDQVIAKATRLHLRGAVAHWERLNKSYEQTLSSWKESKAAFERQLPSKSDRERLIESEMSLAGKIAVRERYEFPIREPQNPGDCPQVMPRVSRISGRAVELAWARLGLQVVTVGIIGLIIGLLWRK